MVLVRGLAATPSGPLPTGIVAVTLMTAGAASAVLVMGDAEAAVAVVAAPGASAATATVTKVTARRMSFMMSCFLAGAGQRILPATGLHGVTPYVKTPGRMGRMANTTKACPERQ